MIDLATLIFSILMFCAIWFLVFKFVLIIKNKLYLKNIEQKIEKQNIKTDLIETIKKEKSKNNILQVNKEEKFLKESLVNNFCTSVTSNLPAENTKKFKFNFIKNIFKRKKEVIKK